MDIEPEGARGVMNRLRCGRSSDFEWLESAHRWTGTTCRAASLDCSGWSEEKARAECGWTGLKAETRSGPGRAGPRSKMYR